MRIVAVGLGGVAVVAALAVGTAALRAGQRPVLSPHEIHAFDVGGAHFVVNYGRPSKRGRTIWGGLVPWGRWWMPGADQATILTTSKPIAFTGLEVPAGDHTLYMLMAEERTDLVVNNQVGQFHTHYDPSQNLGKVEMTMTRVAPPVEQMTFTVESTAMGGRLTLSWDDRAYSAAFMVR